MNIEEIRTRLHEAALATPVVDAHTHVQDDLTGFTKELAAGNLAGTQASVNRPPLPVVEEGIRQGRMVRRNMTDAAHGLFYSWFAQIVEGAGNRLDEALAKVGSNSVPERRAAGRFLMEQLRDSRYSEYAEWLRIMFRMYRGVPPDIDPWIRSISTRWPTPLTRSGTTRGSRRKCSRTIMSWPTSRASRTATRCPSRRRSGRGTSTFPAARIRRPGTCSISTGFSGPNEPPISDCSRRGTSFRRRNTSSTWKSTSSAKSRTWPRSRTPPAASSGRSCGAPRATRGAACCTSTGSRRQDWRFSRPYSQATVDWAIAHHRTQLEGENRAQVIACLAEAMLQALNDVGHERKQAGRGSAFACNCAAVRGISWTGPGRSSPSRSTFPTCRRTSIRSGSATRTSSSNTFAR